ncbi:hypothetical protein [Helicobacter pylori]
MNYIDLALLVVVVAFGIRGFYHGFVSVVLLFSNFKSKECELA